MIFIAVFTLDGHRLKGIIFDGYLINGKFVFIKYFFEIYHTVWLFINFYFVSADTALNNNFHRNPPFIL